MNNRLELQKLLEKIPGVKKVYFQPPETIRMKYPCIRYNRDGAFKIEADDYPYHTRTRYSVTVIDPDPDSKIPDYILNHFQFCRADRNYTADNLNHAVFTIHY